MNIDNQTHQETAYGSNESYWASVPGEPASVGNDEGWMDYLSMGIQMGYLQASICHLICHVAE